MEGGEEVPPSPRAPLREVMWGQTENTRQGPKKAGSGWTRRAHRQSGVGTAGGAGEAAARAGRRAGARGAGHPAGQRDGAGEPRVWPGAGCWGCSFSPLSGRQGPPEKLLGFSQALSAKPTVTAAGVGVSLGEVPVRWSPR